MKNKLFILGFFALLLSSCDFLNIVPDNIATMEMVFQTRRSAMQMLNRCYTAIPSSASIHSNPGLGAGDEFWKGEDNYWYTNTTTFNISKGLQTVSDPYCNFWSGGQGGLNLFVGIRDCNTFLENIDKVTDMELDEIERCKAEVKFIKAYLHFWLLQYYGPIPFVDKNISVSASPEEVKVVREPVDQVVAKIVSLLDEAASTPELPLTIKSRSTEMGRVTKPACLALKAKLLTYAASPLFNGNTDYSDYLNENGEHLFNQTYDPKKWEIARDACKAALECADSAGHVLHQFKDVTGMLSNETVQELTLRETITMRFNDELIYGLGFRDVPQLVGYASSRLTDWHSRQQDWHKSTLAPTLGVVEEFYSKNGLPISEDKTYDYESRYKLIPVPSDHAYYIDQTAPFTPRLFVDREPRFYAWVGFDRGKWYTEEVADDEDAYVWKCQDGEPGGRSLSIFSVTGFLPKKLVPYTLIDRQSSNNISEVTKYPFPILRLSDLYLLYAECLNECKETPDQEVWDNIQIVRTKAGLDKETHSLVDTWKKYSNYPDKPLSKNGMRDIIRQERLIELCFEGQRYNDLRRWKLAPKYYSKPVQGMSVYDIQSAFYTPTVLGVRSFTIRDYFMPIKLDDLYRNNKLQQSPFWD